MALKYLRCLFELFLKKLCDRRPAGFFNLFISNLAEAFFISSIVQFSAFDVYLFSVPGIFWT